MLANVIDPRMDCNINRDTSQIFKNYWFYQVDRSGYSNMLPWKWQITRSKGQTNLKSG